MRLCKECCNSVQISTVRCGRCGRLCPGFSRTAMRRFAVRGGMALIGIVALAAFALAT
jgi:hypothetical protein